MYKLYEKDPIKLIDKCTFEQINERKRCLIDKLVRYTRTYLVYTQFV